MLKLKCGKTFRKINVELFGICAAGAGLGVLFILSLRHDRKRKRATLTEKPEVNPKRSVVPRDLHDHIVYTAFRGRGYDEEEATCATNLCSEAAWHGVSSHNFIKALDIDAHREEWGDACVPKRRWKVLPSKYKACQRWDADRCSGFLVAQHAMDTAMELADEYGIGVVVVDNAFHYLWGAGWVMRASRKGYIAFTTCTGALPEVAPHGGSKPTLGTNPWTWALPTADVLGFDFVMDWATSVVSNGTVKALARDGKPCPAGAIVDAAGQPTLDPNRFHAHACFGGYKGYGLCVLTELLAAFGGGSLPTLRCSGKPPPGEKVTPYFYFQVMRPDAIAGASFGAGRSQMENVRAVAADILNGNSGARLPGVGKHQAAALSEREGGILLSTAEVATLKNYAVKHGVDFPTFFPVEGSAPAAKMREEDRKPDRDN